jgi:hypothetical protein
MAAHGKAVIRLPAGDGNLKEEGLLEGRRHYAVWEVWHATKQCNTENM